VLTVRGDHAMDWFGRISDQSEDLRRSVLEGLRFTPRPDATDIIRAGIRSGNPKLQVSAFDAAALIGDVSLLPIIEDIVDTLEDPRMRAYAVYAASALGTERLSDWIESLIRSQGELQREIAAACLGLQPSEWGSLELEKLSHDPSPRVRIAASASRVRLGIEDAETYLTKQILGTDPRMAQIAAGALKRSDPRYVVELASLVLAAPDVGDEAAGRVLEALGWARDIEAREVLERALSPERDELVRLQSLWAVGWRGRSDELELAERHLDDTSAPVRVMAAWAVLYGGEGGYSRGTGFLSEGRSL
jgi:HEAT repeat protein